MGEGDEDILLSELLLSDSTDDKELELEFLFSFSWEELESFNGVSTFSFKSFALSDKIILIKLLDFKYSF